LAEIKELTPEEEKVNVAVVEIEMLESMGNLLTDYIKSGSINKDILKKVTENVTNYNKTQITPINT
jgi:hypothetical protein